MSFEKNVFINCPFDKEYRLLLRALIFTILYLDLEPQIAATVSSGNIRIQEIKKLIRTSKYSIHDISRCEPLKLNELPRFNMPYEMGLDIGSCEFGSGKLKTKLCLVLEKEKYRYNAVISDISGQDIKDHDNDPKQLINKVREWFSLVLTEQIPPASKLWEHYLDCIANLNNSLTTNGFTWNEIENLSTSEYIKFVRLELQRQLIDQRTFTRP